MAAKAFIPDGYTESGFIAELKNIHEPVRFKFRPVLPEAVRTLMNGFWEKTAKAQGEIVDQTLMRQLVEWDLTDHEGSPLEISVSNLRRIKKPLKDHLFNIVTCFEGSDDDSQAPENDEEAALDFDELLSGESDGKVTPAEGQAKN